MKATLIDLFTSKKFLAALTAVVIYIAGRFGFDVDPAALDRIFAALLVYVGAQGVADVGKGAAEVHEAAFGQRLGTPPAGLETGAALLERAIKAPTVPLALLAALAIGGVALLPACATVKPLADRAEAAVVDCVKADKAPIVALLAELAGDAVTTALAGGVDWGALASKAWSQGKETGGCAFVAFVAGQPKLTARTLAGEAPPDPGELALEQLRARWGGVQWRTTAGLR